MWRVKKEKNETIQKVQIGSVGTGNVNLGNASLGTTTINSLTTNISTASSTTVNIGNTGTSSPSGTVNVGVNSTAVNIGSTTATTTSIKSATISLQNDATTAGTINIKSGATSTGDVNIKTGATSSGAVYIATGTGVTQTTAVNIGSGSTTGGVTIGNTNNTTTLSSSNINIGIVTGGTVQTLGTTNLGLDNTTAAYSYLDVATGQGSGHIDFHNGPTYNNDYDSRLLSSGSSTGNGIDGQGTLQLISKIVQIDGALTMGTGKGIVLQPSTGYVAPTAFTMLGGISNNPFSINIGTTPATGIYYLSSVQVPNNGLYLISFMTQIVYSTPFTYFYSNVSVTDTLQTVGTTVVAPTTITSNCGQQPLGNNGSLFMNTGGSFVATLTATKYYNLILYVSGGGSLGQPNGFFQITRIG